jgi:tRNA(Ile2)-agmatinylcytidine synthase
VAWIGLDDTDTLSGGCTTYEFHRLVNDLTDLSNKGSPWGVPKDSRLVRLWPFASKRTRGNAALAVEIDVKKQNEKFLHQFLDEWYKDLILRISSLEIIQSHHSKRVQFAPEPCLIFSRIQHPNFYWEAVRGNVELNYAKSIIDSDSSLRVWGEEGKMSGLIGCLAAISWKGLEDYTWELTAYREEKMYSKKRKLSNDSVEKMSNTFSNTILNRDPNSLKTLIAPRTPCPVLYGIRSESTEDAIKAHTYLQSINENEKCKSYHIWRTNQATGDHIENKEKGYLILDPKPHKGGHIILQVKPMPSQSKPQSLIAFEETGPVNKLASRLKKDDLIAWQGLNSPEGDIHLEQLKLIKGKPRELKRPLCVCGSRLKSAGKSQPLRCEKCQSTHPRLWSGNQIKESDWVEPDSSQRRHLAKPLGRI